MYGALTSVILVDSNIIIYSRQRHYDDLRDRLAREEISVCTVVQIEVLGWHLLEPHDEAAFRDFFDQAVVYQLDEQVIDQTIALRGGVPRVHLGDAIVAATALVHDLELWTANTDDFAHIRGLKLHDPTKA